MFGIGECDGATEAQVAELRRLLGVRLEEDRRHQVTSTLSENIARTLHRLRPRRFPASELDPSTNHLRNPAAFLP